MHTYKELSRKLREHWQRGEYCLVELQEGGLWCHLPVRSPDAQAWVQSMHLFADTLFGDVYDVDFREKSYAEFQVLRAIIDDCYRYIKKGLKGLSVPREERRLLKMKVLSLKLGGNIPPEILCERSYDVLVQFITRNFLHHTALALQMPFLYHKKQGISIPLENSAGQLSYVPWNAIFLRKTKDRITFYHERQELFVTDRTFRLHPEYALCGKGIGYHDPYFSPAWEPFDWRDPEEWGQKNVLEVWVAHKEDPHHFFHMFCKTHAFLMLRGKEGAVRSVGQDILLEVKNYNLLEILSRKGGYGKIMSPDRYTFYSTCSRTFRKVFMELTDAQYESVIQYVESERRDTARTVSVMKGNCVSFIARVLKNALGMQVKASYHSTHILLRQFISKHTYDQWIGRFVRWKNCLPDLLQKALYFLPFIYVPNVIVASIAKTFMQNNEGNTADYSWCDIFFFPHRVCSHHPLALWESLAQKSDAAGHITIPKK